MQLHKLLVGTLLVLTTASAQAQSVVNGNFNTDLSGWTHNTDTQWVGDDGPDNQVGLVLITNSNPSATGFINQTLTGLSAGVGYDINGYYESYGGFNGSHSLTAQVDGVTDFSNTDTHYVTSWEPFNFTFTAGSSTAVLQINSQVGSNTNYLVDEVSITQATPEPGSLAIIVGIGISGSIFALRRRYHRTR